MLVISRKQNELVQIGPDIEVVVTRVDGNKVKLGIHAPDSVKILRAELGAVEPEPDAPLVLTLDADQPLWLARLKSTHKLVYAVRTAETEEHLFWLKEVNR